MATNRRRKDDQETTPFNDPVFRRRAVNFNDIEFQRNFEQNLIRFGLLNGAQVTQRINNAIVVSGGGNVEVHDKFCYWTKEGPDIVYYGGNVGVGIHPYNNDFEVKGNVLVEAASEQPYVEIRNWSDTAFDPAIKWSVGATPLTKFVTGVDDSDSDKWKISNLSALGTLAESQGSFGERLVFVHDTDDDIDFVELSDFTTDGVLVSTTQGSGDGQLCTTPKSLATDGVCIYEADDTNNRVQKFDATTGAFIAKLAVRRPWGLCLWDGVLYCLTSTAALSGGVWNYQLLLINPDTMAITGTYDYEQGSADDELNAPRGMSTDGTNLFICDTSNRRIKKTSLTGIYVNKVGAAGTGNGQFGAGSPTDCEVDGNYIYACDYANGRIQIFDKATLAYVAQHSTQIVGGDVGSPASIAINDVYYYIGVLNGIPFESYIEKYDIATRSFQASYDCVVATLDKPDALWGLEIAKFATSTEKYGDLFVVHQDGAYIDHWPICRFVDDIRLIEDGDLATGDYVGLRAPGTVTTSYTLTLPAAAPAGQSHVSCNASGILSFGQDVNTTASPSFVRLTLTQATGTAPMTITSTTVVTNLNADMVDGLHGTSLAQVYISATASPTVNDDINQTPTAFREGCIWVEQDSNTVWFCADNADGAAVWHGVNQDLLTTSPVAFGGATLSDNLIVYRDGACAISQYSCGASDYAQISIYRSRGTYASKTSVADEDYVGRIEFFAYADNPAMPYSVGVIESQVKAISGVTPYGALNIAARDAGAVGIYLSETQNIGLFTSTFGTDAVKVLALATGTAPTTAPADAFQMYSKDYAAGHAAPHFRIESGEEVSLRDDGYYVDGVLMGGAGGGAFTDLTDAPASYVGHAGKFVKVNAGETALEFVASSVAAHNLVSGSHADIDATGLSDDDILRYDSASGQWKCEALPAASAHDLLSASHGDAAAAAVSRGSLIVGNSTPAWSELVVGAAGTVLTSDGTDVTWAAPAEPGMYTLLNENLDGLSTAALHAQGSYTYFAAWASTLVGTSTINVVAHPVSGKMIQVTGDTVTEGSSHSDIVTGFDLGLAFGTRIRWKMRTSNVAVGTKGCGIGSAFGAETAQVYFRNTDSSLSFYNGAAITKLMDAVNDTWYQIDMVIVHGTTTPYAYIFIDGVQQGAPKACGAATLTTDTFWVYCNTTGTAAAVNLDVDDIQIGTNMFWNLVE